MLKVRQTISEETNPLGAISSKHTHTPNAQYKLISLEDFLFMTLAISGIFHKGSITAAISAIFSIVFLMRPALRYAQDGRIHIKTMRPAGVGPATSSSEDWRSIQLSYGRV